MVLDDTIYSRANTNLPATLAGILSPQNIGNIRLENEARQAKMDEFARQRKLSELLQSGGDAGQIADRLAQGGMIKEAEQYRQIGDAQTQRQDAEAQRRHGLMKNAFGQIYANPTAETARAVLGALPFVNPQKIDEEVATLEAMPPESRQAYYLAKYDPALYAKQQETQRAQDQTRADKKEQAAATEEQKRLDREARTNDLKLRLADSRLAAQDRLAMQKELAQMRIDAQKDAIQAKNAPKEAANEAMKAQQSISAQQVLDQATKLFNHPGREAGTGSSSWVGKIPLISSDAKDFQSELDTFKAQTFVPMVSALKGMGALSDAEGKKLTDSVGALNPNMQEKTFVESLKGVARTLYAKAKAAGLNVEMPAFAEQRKQEKPASGADAHEEWVRGPDGKLRRK